MKIKALVTSLILGASSIALADSPSPSIQFDANRNFRDRDGDYFRDQRDQRGSWRARWMPLSDQITAARRNTIRLNERTDDLRAIRLQNGSGATYVYSISIRFDDGSRETIPVAKWLYAGVPMLTFDLPQQRGGVDRISVQTWTSVPSTYQIMGQMSRVARPQYEEPLPPPPPLPTQPPISQQGINLGTDLSFANTAGYVHIPVGADKGVFHKLRITSAGAGVVLGRVYVTFATGAHQMFDLNKALYRGEVVELDLEGKTHAITAVTIMAGDDVRQVGPSAGRFAVSLL